MIALEQARGYLEQLGMVEAALVLESRLEAAAHRQIPYVEFLADLLAVRAHPGRAEPPRAQEDPLVCDRLRRPDTRGSGCRMDTE